MGDTGSFDAEGRFWLAGRVHSTIRRAGVPRPSAARRAGRPRRRPPHPPDRRRGGARSEPGRARRPGRRDGRRKGSKARSRAGSPPPASPPTRSSSPPTPLPVDPRHNSKIDYGKLRERLRTGPGKGRRPRRRAEPQNSARSAGKSPASAIRRSFFVTRRSRRAGPPGTFRSAFAGSGERVIRRGLFVVLAGSGEPSRRASES